MPSHDLKSKQVLHKQFSDQAREQGPATILIPAKYAHYSVEDLFRQFKLAKMDTYGNYASAYGEYGFGVGISVGVDLVALLTGPAPNPGFLPSASLSANGEGERLAETMLILQQVSPRHNKHKHTNISGQRRRKGYKWRTKNPIALMPFSGIKKGFTGTISLDFSSGAIPLAGVAGYGLVPDIKGGSANITVALSKQKFAWGTDLPRWYPDYNDPNITVDFGNFLGAPAKVRIKEEIIEWLRYLRNIVKRVDGDFMNSLKQELKDLPKRRFHRTAHRTPRLRNTSTEEIGEKLDKIITEVRKVMLMNWEGESILITNDRQEIVVQLEWFQQALKKARDEETFAQAANESKSDEGIPSLWFRNPTEWFSLDQAVKDRYAKLCFARLALWNPKLTADIGLTLQPKIINLDHGDGDAATNLSVTVNPGSLSAGFSVRYATSRYQSFALSQHSARPLIMTQDTYIRYSQWWFSAQIAATMDNLRTMYADKLSRSKGLFRINKLKYSSVTAFWLHHERTGSGSASLRPGTGISFGTHINPAEMESFARKLALPETKENAWLKAKYYADRMRMNRAEFESFAAAFKQHTTTDLDNWENIKNKYSAILLESAFRFSAETMGTTDGKLNDMLAHFDSVMKKGVDLETSTHTAAPFTLESVRVRVRMEDHRSGPSTSYKLGWSHGPVSLAINFKKVTRSGNEGIWEYLYYAAEDTPPVNVVPPAVLLPHTFQ